MVLAVLVLVPVVVLVLAVLLVHLEHLSHQVEHQVEAVSNLSSPPCHQQAPLVRHHTPPDIPSQTPR